MKKRPNARQLTRLEQGEGTTLMGKLYITRIQRQKLLKWGLYALVFLVLLVLQDSVLSRLHPLEGSIQPVSAMILLVCVLETPEAAGGFALATGLFWCLSGAELGSASVLLLPAIGMTLSAFRMANLRGRFSSAFLCCGAGLLAHDGLRFLLALFLGYTRTTYLPAAAVTWAVSWMLSALLYLPAKSIGKIGGQTWTE